MSRRYALPSFLPSHHLMTFNRGFGDPYNRFSWYPSWSQPVSLDLQWCTSRRHRSCEHAIAVAKASEGGDRPPLNFRSDLMRLLLRSGPREVVQQRIPVLPRSRNHHESTTGHFLKDGSQPHALVKKRGRCPLAVGWHYNYSSGA